MFAIAKFLYIIENMKHLWNNKGNVLKNQLGLTTHVL